jgi:hypothetical protein
MNDLLRCCPTDVLVHELYPLLDMIDVCRLDTAATACRPLRPLLLEVYARLYPPTHHVHCSQSQLRWFLARAVPLRQLVWSRAGTPATEITATLEMILTRQGFAHDQLALQEIDISGCCSVARLVSSPPPSSGQALALYEQSGALLAACAGQLLSLRLQHCRHLSKSLLAHVAARHPLLTSLDLSGGVLSDQLVFAALPPPLRSLDLSHCSRLSDAAVVVLAQRCSQLTRLDLSCCSELTDAAVFALAVRCPALASLSLSRCHHVSAAAAVALCCSCRCLHSLSLRHCLFGDSLDELLVGIHIHAYI